MSIYTIETCKTSCTSIGSFAKLDDWLTDKAPQHTQAGLSYLIAFTLDGLFWGRLDDGKWIKKSASTEWNEKYVQEIRLFGKDAEIHLWRVGGQWNGRCIDDNGGDDFTEMIKDQHILWGDTVEKQDGGFTRLADGQQGLRYWLPLKVEAQNLASLRLSIRHYLAPEDFARIVVSRLVGFLPKEGVPKNG